MADISGPITLSDVFTQWRIDWVTLAVTVAVGIGYVRVRLRARRQGLSWPVRRDVMVALGLLAALWTSSGILQARSTQLMWVWTTQQLLLLLVIPVIVLAGQPLSLLRMVDADQSRVIRTLGSRPVRAAGHPLLGPLLVPVFAGALFFGGLGVLALTSAAAGWGLHLLLLGVGALIALPLVDRDDPRSSLAVGLALGVGLIELMLDSFPGIVLSFHTHLTIAQFGVDRPAWAGSALDDQHTAGGIMWAVAEVLDLPFLVLAATRWLRADTREARRIDAEIDAAEAAQVLVADRPSDIDDSSDPAAVRSTPSASGSRPWWLDDPELRDRYRE